MNFKEIIANDLDVFLNPEEFGEEVIIEDKRLFGIFDEEYEVINVEDNTIEGTSPIVTIKASDASGIKRHDKVQIRFKNFHVLEIKPDGTGLTTLVLGKR